MTFWAGGKRAVSMWLAQRISAVILIPLGLWFIYFLISLVGLDRLEILNRFSYPHNAVLMSSFIIVTFYHAQLGLNEVIEDYVHHKTLRLTLLLFIRFLAVLLIGLSLLAILKIIGI